MSNKRKTILVIEDEDNQRKPIILSLSKYDFNVLGADSIAGSLELLNNHKDDGVVAILDMKLNTFPDYDDKKEGAISGVGLARKVLQESSARRPEILILSAYAERVDYYKQAIETGASAFLIKGADAQKLVPTVQALALKHSFRPDSFNDAEMSRLTEGHASSFALLEFFIDNKLLPELELCLTRESFILLVRDASETPPSPEHSSISVRSNLREVPDPEEFDYSTLHQKIFTQIAPHRIYQPETGASQDPESLKEMVFVQLANTPDVEIALGIPNVFPVRDKYGSYEFSTLILAESLIQHVAPALELYVQKLCFVWKDKQRARLEHLKTNIDLSAVLQRRFSDLLTHKAATGNKQDYHLKALMQDLSEYNRLLSTLFENAESASPASTAAKFRLSDVVREIGAGFDMLGNSDDPTFQVETDCVIPAERYFFTLALRELIRWAIIRKNNLIADQKHLIQLSCVRKGNWMEISFNENSARIPDAVREAYLFEPMSPLQVAQVIIEVACHGTLSDDTGKLSLSQGHLFTIKLLHN